MRKFQFKNLLQNKKTIFRILIEILLFSYVFCIPTFGENTGVLKYLIYINLILLTIFAFSYTLLYDKITIYKSTLLIPLFALFALIGTIYYSHEFRSWLTLVFLCISFYSLFLTFCILKNEIKVISIISLAIGLFCLVFIFYFRDSFLNFSSLASGKTRLGPPFDNANGISAYSVVCFGTSLYLVLFGKKWLKYIFLLPLFLSFIVGLSTGSRSFILFALVFLLILFFVRFRNRKILCLIALCFLVGLIILLFSLPALSFLKFRLINSLKTIIGTSDKADTSTLSRINYTSYGFYMGTKNLLAGFGSGGFGLVTGMNTYAHSNFAEVLCNFGFIGFVLFYLPLILLLVKSIFDSKVNKTFIIPFVIYYMVAGFTNVLYYKKVYYLILAFMFYLAYYSPTLKANFKSTKRKLNVCFLADSMGSGGAERVISSLGNEMVKKGHNVTILLVSTNVESSYYDLNENIKVISLVKNYEKKTSSLKRIFLLRKFYRKNDFDIVYAFLKHICIYNWIGSIGFSFKTVVSERNDPNQYSKKEQFLLKRAFYAADRCVFQTQMAMDWYGDDISIKSVIIFNPVHLMTNQRNKNRTKTIISVGRLEEQKNYDFLIEVFDNFHREFPEYNFKIYGEGTLKTQIQNKINDLKMDKFILLIGNDKNWHDHEYNAACFVLSSKFEGMPNALEEAACLGIPCVSSNCNIGGPFELSKKLPNIILVDEYKIDDYVDSMKKAILSEYKEIDTSAFMIEKICDEWLKLYE